MDKEQKAAFSDMGKQAEMRNRLVNVAQKKVQIAIHTPARIAKRG